MSIRYEPNNARRVIDKLTGATAFLYDNGNGQPCLLAYRNSTNTKPDCHFRYRDAETRDAKAATFLRSARNILEARLKQQAERRAERSKPHSLQIGHILTSSWGYDQTNIDFYEVTAIPSPCFVMLARLGSVTIEQGPNYTGKVVPDIDGKRGEAKRYRAGPDNSVKIESYAYARIWDGKPCWFSSYA